MWWRRAVLPSLPWGFCFLSFFLGTGLARALALFVCDCVDFGFLFSFSRLVRSRQDTLQTSHTFTQSNHMPPRRRDCLRVAGGQSNATAAELLFGALVRGSSDRSEPAAGDRAASDRRQNPQRLPCPFSFFLSRAQCRAREFCCKILYRQGARWGRCPPPTPGLASLIIFVCARASPVPGVVRAAYNSFCFRLKRSRTCVRCSQ